MDLRWLALGLLLLPGCMDDAGNGEDGETHEVTIENFAFDPADLEIEAGDTVRWTNQDSAAHTATGEGTFDSGTMQTGETFDFTFDEPGTFDYICTIHPEMTASVTVT